MVAFLVIRKTKVQLEGWNFQPPLYPDPGGGEGRGGEPEPRELPQLRRHSRKWRRLWEGKRGRQGCGMWGGADLAPCTQPPAAQGAGGEGRPCP